MKQLLSVVLILSLSVLAACQPVTLEEAEAQFCDDLRGFQTALSAYRNLDENSMLDEVDEATELAARAYDDLIQSATALQNVQADALDEVYDVLRETVSDLEGETTVGQATDDITAALNTLVAASDEIYATSCQ